MRPIREPILYEVCVTLTIEWRDFGLKEYDLIAIGTGSAMNIVEAMVRQNPQLKVAVIDKDEPGEYALRAVAFRRRYCCIPRNW